MKTIEKNIAIQKFVDPNYFKITECEGECLSYDKEWNWIMDAWSKFKELKFEGDTANPNYWEAGIWNEKIGAYILSVNLQGAFEQLYNGIEWHNSLNKN